MKDVGLAADAELGPADRAVKYLLDRIQHDRNLRWYMLGTQAMCLLVQAEAARTGRPLEEVEAERGKWLGGDNPVPDVARMREALEELAAELSEVARMGGPARTATLRRWADQAERAVTGG